MENPPRWELDPTGRHQYRWWDGNRWTDQVADDGITSSDPLATSTVPTNKPFRWTQGKVVLVVCGALVLVAGISATVAGGEADKPERAQLYREQNASTPTTERQHAEPDPTTTTAPPTTAALPPPPPPPPPTAAPAPACHPSYQGECLPPDASDVDCEGGGGNGPAYAQTKNIRVVGPDVYDLDRDGNGYGCED